MRRSISSVILLLALLPFISQAQEKGAAKTIPILAWYSIPPEQTTLARYIELKACGFTHNLSFFNDAESMAAALDTAQKAGIKMIVYCPELKTEPEKTVRRFMDHPAVAGYMLRDEPNVSDFPELGSWAARISKTDPHHYCYLNLFPNYASEQQLGTKTYQEHVDRFVKEVPLEFISFDHYPVMGDSLRANWYENLEIIAAAARKAAKPFWAFSLSVAHGKYPVPTVPQMRLQIFSDLAYGAQGLEYFTYWTPVDTSWNFNTGPVTADGKRTVVWDRVAQVNREIHALSFVFSGAKVISVAHTGTIPQGTKSLGKLPGQISRLETKGTGAVVSRLKNGSDNYLVIVNRDFLRPMELIIDCSPEVHRILKDGTTASARAYQSSVEVDPGDMVIYSWK